jgi:hypothetical protein
MKGNPPRSKLIKWTDTAISAFEDAKEATANATLLVHPDHKPLVHAFRSKTFLTNTQEAQPRQTTRCFAKLESVNTDRIFLRFFPG